MILTQPGQTFFCEDSKLSFSIGQEIVANDSSMYAGLSGVITEVRDGAGKETDNPSADIYCDFALPGSVIFRRELEKRFSMPADELSLDQIIMAPEMLEPMMRYQVAPRPMYVLTYFIDCDEDTDTYVLAVSDDKRCLRKRLEAHKAENMRLRNLDHYKTSEDDMDGYAFIANSDTVYICYSILEAPFETDAKGGNNDAA